MVKAEVVKLKTTILFSVAFGWHEAIYWAEF